MTKPGIDLFRAAGKGSKNWRLFAEELVPNVPVEIPGATHANSSGGQMARKYGHEMGRDIRIRSFDGKVWACWVVEEDQS